MPEQSAVAAVPSTARRRLLPIFVIVAIDAMGMGLILPLLPFYATRFGARPELIGAILASYALCQLWSAPLLGRLSDRIGRKPVLLLSQFGTCIGLILLALANSIPMLFLARIIDGISAGNLAVASATAVDQAGPAHRRQAVGVVSAGVGVGYIGGPALTALLMPIGPTAPIWTAAIFAMLSIGGTLFLLPPSPPRRVAAPGAAGSGSLLAKGSGVLVASLAILGAFYLAYSLFLSQLALFMHGRFSWGGEMLGARQVGLAFAAGGAINIVVQLFALEKLSRHFPERVIAPAGYALLIFGFAGLAMARDTGLLAMLLVMAFVGASLVRPIALSTASHQVSPDRQGQLMGTSQALFALAGVIGPLMGGLLIGRRYYAGWALTLAALMVASAAGMITLFARGLIDNDRR